MSFIALSLASNNCFISASLLVTHFLVNPWSESKKFVWNSERAVTPTKAKKQTKHKHSFADFFMPSGHTRESNSMLNKSARFLPLKWRKCESQHFIRPHKGQFPALGASLSCNCFISLLASVVIHWYGHLKFLVYDVRLKKKKQKNIIYIYIYIGPN